MGDLKDTLKYYFIISPFHFLLFWFIVFGDDLVRGRRIPSEAWLVFIALIAWCCLVFKALEYWNGRYRARSIRAALNPAFFLGLGPVMAIALAG